MKNTLFILIAFYSVGSIAGVYKCTDDAGNTSYQTKPCGAQKQAYEMNIKTGTKVDLTQQKNLRERDKKQKQLQLDQQKREQQLLSQNEAQRKKDAIAESAITQALIKGNPRQYSAFAIPAYNPENLPPRVIQFESRLPEIEKLRRLAAQKALASGQCQRVEADELDVQSQKNLLVFQVGCSSGKNFYFNESELTDQ